MHWTPATACTCAAAPLTCARGPWADAELEPSPPTPAAMSAGGGWSAGAPPDTCLPDDLQRSVCGSPSERAHADEDASAWLYCASAMAVAVYIKPAGRTQPGQPEHLRVWRCRDLLPCAAAHLERRGTSGNGGPGGCCCMTSASASGCSCSCSSSCSWFCPCSSVSSAMGSAFVGVPVFCRGDRDADFCRLRLRGTHLALSAAGGSTSSR